MREEGGSGRKERRVEERPPPTVLHRVPTGWRCSANCTWPVGLTNYARCTPAVEGTSLVGGEGGARPMTHLASWFPQLSPPLSAIVVGRGALRGQGSLLWKPSLPPERLPASPPPCWLLSLACGLVPFPLLGGGDGAGVLGCSSGTRPPSSLSSR